MNGSRSKCTLKVDGDCNKQNVRKVDLSLKVDALNAKFTDLKISIEIVRF